MLDASKIIEVLKAHEEEFRALGVTRLTLFGSYARNQQRDDSDVDLAARFDEAKKPSPSAALDAKFLAADLLGLDDEALDFCDLKFMKPGVKRGFRESFIDIFSDDPFPFVGNPYSMHPDPVELRRAFEKPIYPRY